MSGKSLGIMVFTVAFAFAAICVKDVSREPALVSDKLKLFSEGSRGAKHTFKVRGPMDVSIELLGARPNGEGDAFVLRGLVTSSEALRDVEYSWNIPAELELINGTLSSVISNIDPGQPVSVQVTLRQKGFANERVHFRARGVSGAMKFGASAQYNSMLQETLEASRLELKKSAEEELASQRALGLAPLRKNIRFDSSAHSHGGLKVAH